MSKALSRTQDEAKLRTRTPAQSTGAGRTVQSFVLETLERIGAAVEEVDWGVCDVLLPREQVRRITFDPEVAQERVDCALVTYGTPFLESMVEHAKSHGKVQVRRIEARSEAPQNLDDKLPGLVHFVKCKPPRVKRTWREEGLLLLCQFHVTFHADEVVEDVVSGLIDLGSLADVTHLLPALVNHWFAADPAADGGQVRAGADAVAPDAIPPDAIPPDAIPLPIATPFSLQAGFAAAARAVAPVIERRIAQIRLHNRPQLEDELEKSRHYYQTTLRKLEQQLRNAVEADRNERLRQKIEATQRDRDRRMEDISRAYDVAADVWTRHCSTARPRSASKRPFNSGPTCIPLSIATTRGPLLGAL